MLIDTTVIAAGIILLVALFIGLILVRLPLIDRFYLPASVAAGLLLLALSPQVTNIQFPEFGFTDNLYDSWSSLPSLLINVVFASLFLARPLISIKKIWKIAAPQAAYGQMIAWGFYGIGGLLTLFVLIPYLGVNPLTAALIEISFEGGHGTAAGMIPVFEELNFQQGQEMAVALATTSMIAALTVGIALINWGRRKGYVNHETPVQRIKGSLYHRHIMMDLKKRGVSLRRELSPLKLLSHVALLATGVGFGWLIYQGLLLLEANTWGANGVKIFGYMPLFTFCMFGGMFAQRLWSLFGLSISRPTVEILSAVSLSVLVTTAIATMSLDFISTDGLTYLALAAAGILWVLFCFLVLARHMFKKDWFAYAITSTGQSLGTTATGLLFSQIVDPKQRTGAVESFGYKQLLFEPLMGGGMITALSMPLIFAFGLPLFTTVCTIISISWMLAGIFIFSKQRR